MWYNYGGVIGLLWAIWLTIKTYYESTVKRIQDYDPLRRGDADSFWWIGYTKFKWYRWENNIVRGLQQTIERVKPLGKTGEDGKIDERRYRVLVVETNGRDLDHQKSILDANDVVSRTGFIHGDISVWPEPNQVVSLFGTGGGVIRNTVPWAMKYEVPGAAWVKSFRLDQFQTPVNLDVKKIWLFMESPEIAVEALVNSGYQGTIVLIHPNANGIVKTMPVRFLDMIQWPLFAAESPKDDDLVEYGRLLGEALVGGNQAPLLAKGYKTMDKKPVPVDIKVDVSIRF